MTYRAVHSDDRKYRMTRKDVQLKTESGGQKMMTVVLRVTYMGLADMRDYPCRPPMGHDGYVPWYCANQNT